MISAVLPTAHTDSDLSLFSFKKNFFHLKDCRFCLDHKSFYIGFSIFIIPVFDAYV